MCVPPLFLSLSAPSRGSKLTSRSSPRPSSSSSPLALADLPDGNTKVTTFEVDTRVLNKPVVRVKVWIDGAEAWHVDVLGQPILRPGPLTVVDGAVGSLGKGLRELLTFLRRSWWN